MDSGSREDGGQDTGNSTSTSSPSSSPTSSGSSTTSSSSSSPTSSSSSSPTSSGSSTSCSSSSSPTCSGSTTSSSARLIRYRTIYLEDSPDKSQVGDKDAADPESVTPKHMIPKRNVLFSKSYDSTVAKVYCLQEGTTQVKETEIWKNCAFLASSQDGWILFLSENGKNLFYLHVERWKCLKLIPPLPDSLSPSQCMVMHNGWTAYFCHEPSSPNNKIILMGLIQYYHSRKQELVILSLEPNKRRKWLILRIDNNMPMQLKNGVYNITVIEGVVSGPVFLLRNDEEHICWVSSGYKLQVLTLTSFREVHISKFENGELPVNIVVRPGRQDYLYLYQYREEFDEPPLIVRVHLPDLVVSSIHHFPATFYMPEYKAGYADDDGWSEDGEDEKEFVLIEYGVQDTNFKETSEGESEESESEDEENEMIVTHEEYIEENANNKERIEESVNKEESSKEIVIGENMSQNTINKKEISESSSNEEVRVKSEASNEGFFASSLGHHIVNYHPTEGKDWWQLLEPHPRCQDSFAFFSFDIHVSDTSSSA